MERANLTTKGRLATHENTLQGKTNPKRHIYKSSNINQEKRETNIRTTTRSRNKNV